MRRSLRRWAAVASVILLLGCSSDYSGSGSQRTTTPGGISQAADDSLPLVAHPEFANWSQFEEGIVVVRNKEVSNESGTVRVTTTLRLAQKAANKVVVESQVTAQRPGQPPEQNPPFIAEFPATFRLPAGMRLEQFTLPSLRARQIGEESRAVSGRDYPAQIFTWDERNEAGPMTVKLWRSDNVPGRMLRQEVQGSTQASVEEVVAVTSPESTADQSP